jgi:hypothetical protein
MQPEATTTGADVIEVGDQFYIKAQSSLADDRTRVPARRHLRGF